MGLKTLTEEEMDHFKHWLDCAEEFPNSDEWVEDIKSRLQIIKPDWTKEDVDGFVDDYFENSPIVNAVLEHCKIKLSILE